MRVTLNCRESHTPALPGWVQLRSPPPPPPPPPPPESLHYDSSHKSLLARQALPEFLVESGQVCGEVRVPSQLEQPGHSILNTAGRNP